MQQAISELKAANIGDVLVNKSLAEFTTWKIGGPADVLIVPHTKDQLVQAVRILHSHGIPWSAIGRGSNMLVSDKGIRGVVIKLGEGLDYVRFEGNIAVAGASYSFIKLSIMAGKQGLTGLEFAGGIPGTVGGAVYMNAGAHGSDVSRILTSAEILTETGELRQWQPEDLKFDYRHSVLHEQRGLVTEATFELSFGDRKEIAAAMASYKDRRLKTQPLQLACAGSVFRNPPGTFAAKLIEEAGLKGLRVGDAEVSVQHANFIVNTGKAKASDVLTLMAQVKDAVKARFGVELVPEVLVVGER
ncbi:UDP-N-acetylmuramate dehydrogenase [Paenibacillus gansuensis]|uniref:UDP-N-acetylenolpyruvoylglucosamine reductase n=1 Tax=Paenibacillus gansuensis TaxID=306542 RepID=A0ABW5PC51_9BACL